MQRIPRLRPSLGPLLLAALTVTCNDEPPTAPSPLTPSADLASPAVVVPSTSPVATAASEVFVGAGDIATCSSDRDEATAKLLDAIPGTVFTVGDHAYSDGTATEFTNCYEPTWGRHKARTRPAPGDRDYRTAGASGYYGYFGAAAGDPAKGYYSYDLGDWHVVVLNTEISVSATSAQVTWLRADLAASGKACTMAIWHRPYITSSDV